MPPRTAAEELVHRLRHALSGVRLEQVIPCVHLKRIDRPVRKRRHKHNLRTRIEQRDELKAIGERHPDIEKNHFRPQRSAQGMSLTDRAGFTDHGQLGMRLETFPQVGPSIGLIIDD